MSVAADEGVVVDGLIHMPDNVRLPERTKVYDLVPAPGAEPISARIASPRLASPADAGDFVMEVDEVSDGEV